MTNPIHLVIDVAADPGEAVRGLGKISTAADDVGDSVAQAGRDAQTASSKLDLVAGSADTLDSKAGRATGAMGALAAGFSFLGAENAAAGLESAAMATDGLSGAGQALSLVLELQFVKTVKAKAATLAKTVADKAAAVATRSMAAAQWVLNAAMSANPIGLVVIAVVALVAVLTIAYQRSDRVRAIIQAAGAVGKRAFSAIVAGVSNLVSWVRDKVPPAFERLKEIVINVVKIATIQIRLIIAVIRLIADKAPAIFAAMKDAIVERFIALKTRAVEIFEAVRSSIVNKVGKIAGAVGEAKETMIGFFEDLLKPVQKVIDLVQDLIDKVKLLKFPDLNPLGRVSLGRQASFATDTGGSSSSTAPNVVYNITVTGALDPLAVARQIQGILYGSNRLLGVAP